MSSVVFNQLARVGGLVPIAMACQDTITSPTHAWAPPEADSVGAAGGYGFNTADQLVEVCCRIGSNVTTTAGETRPCTDAFQ